MEYQVIVQKPIRDLAVGGTRPNFYVPLLGTQSHFDVENI